MTLTHPIPPTDERFDGSTTPLRAALALREFVRGNLTLEAAVDLAGVSQPDFVELLARLESPDLPADFADPEAECPLISAVIPVYNEEGNLPVLHARLSPVLAALGRYEIIFVDDGSRDRSYDIILELQRRDPAVKLVRFSRNFGHQAALCAGIDHARGDTVVLMDADLQDPPELLPTLVERWREGYQVVYAVREKRDEGLFKRATASAFYRLLRVVSEVEIPVDTGDFCLMDRSVVEAIRQLPEKNRFLRGLRSWVGFRQIGVTYARPERFAGEVKYTVRKMVKLAVDGLLAFTSLPLRLASYLGSLTALAGIGYLGIAVFAKLFTGEIPQGWTSLVAIILTLGGTQLLVMGALGAYIARIYDETKARPLYVVAETRGTGTRTTGPVTLAPTVLSARP